MATFRLGWEHRRSSIPKMYGSRRNIAIQICKQNCVIMSCVLSIIKCVYWLKGVLLNLHTIESYMFTSYHTVIDKSYTEESFADLLLKQHFVYTLVLIKLVGKFL